MNEIFAKMFALPPDEIAGSDYFYRVPWLEEAYPNPPSAEALAQAEERSKREFMHYWEKRTFEGDINDQNEPINAFYKEAEVKKIIGGIAGGTQNAAGRPGPARRDDVEPFGRPAPRSLG